MTEIDAYLKSKQDTGYFPRSLSSICSAFRLFFHLAEKEGWNTSRISFAIQRPRISRHDSAPRGPEWSDLRRMIDHDLGSTAADIRADAIVAISGIYAFRNIEIIRLRLADFDWTNEMQADERRMCYCKP